MLEASFSYGNALYKLGTWETHPRGHATSSEERGLVRVVNNVPYGPTPERNAKQKKSKSKYLEAIREAGRVCP